MHLLLALAPPLMSHDQVELQRILSTTSNGSFHRGSSATMSRSGSFSSVHMHHHTDTDDAPNPVYSSIPESQMAHHQYKDNQLQHQVRGVAGGCGQWHGKWAVYVGMAGGCRQLYNHCIPLYLGMAGGYTMWVWQMGVACSTTLYYEHHQYLVSLRCNIR